MGVSPLKERQEPMRRAQPGEVAAETVAQKATKKFWQIEEELKTFMKDAAIYPILQEFHALVISRNEALDEAVRNVKSELQRSDNDKLVVEGIGAQKRTKVYYDVEFLAEHLPMKQAQLVLTEKLVHELNQPLLEQLLRQGEIDNGIVRDAYHEEAQNPASLPGTPKPWTIPPLPVLE